MGRRDLASENDETQAHPKVSIVISRSLMRRRACPATLVERIGRGYIQTRMAGEDGSDLWWTMVFDGRKLLRIAEIVPAGKVRVFGSFRISEWGRRIGQKRFYREFGHMGSLEKSVQARIVLVK